jgi:tRNA (cytidine/uridine-2'-O-)-methyltransferase
LLFGRESSGVTEKIHAAADARLVIPMREGLRSLNVAMAAAMAVGEAKRQLEASSRAAGTVVPKSADEASKRRGG